MKRKTETGKNARSMMMLMMSAMMFTPLLAQAGTVALSTQPMMQSAPSNVKPNVMFILDDSGTMDYDRLPDWASGSVQNQIKNSAYNGVTYNPATNYAPPAYFDPDGKLNTTKYLSQTAANSTNWTSVKNDAYGVQTTGSSNLVGNAYSYVTIAGEYCTAQDLKDCVAATAPSATYPYPARLRWCSNTTDAAKATPAAGTCQGIRISPYIRIRYPNPPTATITVGGSGATSATSITVGGQQILSAMTDGTLTTTAAVATAIKNAINACSATATGGCTTSGFSATVSGSTVTLIANSTGTFAKPVILQSGTMTLTPSTFSGGNQVPGSTRYIEINSVNNSYPYPGSTSKAPGRTDCAGTVCTYAEEMTNYANWWTYYHTRLQAMKTSVSRAFKSIDNRFRVGFSTICDHSATTGTLFLANDTFETTHKNNWFNKLFSTGTSCFTPLRGALSKTGRYYAGKVGAVDPVQYSCQQNFAILSTDGYWNTDQESPSSPTGDGCTNNNSPGSNYGPYQVDNKTCVGNQDGGTTDRPMKEGTTAVSNTLADVAKYYYETDLRDTALGNCTGGKSVDFPSGNPNVCPNNVFVSPTDNKTWQHMTTFTMGLGASGTLNYTADYDTATSGDFYNLKKGLAGVNWPDPIANKNEQRIDDLWHAAVNGRGMYFSAQDPDQIVTGFNKALSSITAKLGAAAAAATSTLNPVAGDNYAFVASYMTVKWKGNLEARSINTATGVVSSTASWCVEDVVPDACPVALTQVTSGSSTIYNCVVPGATATTCTAPSVFDSAAGTCTTEVAKSCAGTLPPMVGATTDTRTIYTADTAANVLIPFDTAFATANPGYFNSAAISGLSQWGSLNPSQQTAAQGANLLGFLRGQKGHEQTAAAPIDRLYRSREAVLGDTVESQPFFIAAPVFSYSYPGYSDFKINHANRAGTVYVGANDGMLHAFAGDTGVERWAYVPSMVIPNMWKLADTNYSTSHVNYVNGSVTISDVCFAANCSTATAADWHTILVGGLNGGGRGYYALDVTDPTAPSLLWEFTDTSGKGSVQDADLGYSFSRPQITRKADGTWVVLVTSGYNNVSPGSGKGVLYVLSAKTGNIISKISTGVGTTASPSGLGKIAVWNNEAAGNLAGYVYGGDLEGNVWRFDINTPGKFLLATLYSDTAGTKPQPITTAPALGEASNYRMIFVGTGKYLEPTDLDNLQLQTLYAIKDNDATTTLVNPRASTKTATTQVDKMVQQTITDLGGVRDGSNNAVDLTVDRGWYVDFPDASNGSERVALEAQLVKGTLLVATLVPSSSICNPGGYSWLNFFNYADGTPVQSATNKIVSIKYDSIIVGFNIIFIQGKPVVEVVTSTNPTPEVPQNAPDMFKSKGSADFKERRSMWRELGK